MHHVLSAIGMVQNLPADFMEFFHGLRQRTNVHDALFLEVCLV